MSTLFFRAAKVPLLLAALIALFAAPSALAAWGDPDTTFGGNGWLNTIPTGSTFGDANAMLVQPDGKILLAGEAGVWPSTTGMIQRRLPDGSPDTSFGSGGTLLLTTPAGLTATDIKEIALQSDGSIVAVATRSPLDSRILRVTSTGQIDTTFAAPNGYLSYVDEDLDDVFVAASGDIFVSGHDDGSIILRRYTSAGGQVGAFASNAAAGLTGVSSYSTDPVLIEPSGSGVLMAMSREQSGNVTFFAARFDVAGNIDTGWGTNGKTEVGFSINANAAAAFVQPNGAFVIGGNTEVMGDAAAVLTRLTPGGMLDPTFVGGGTTEFSMTPGGDGIRALANTPDGGLVAFGSGDNPTTNNSVGAVRMMTADGVPRSEFGPEGVRLLELAGDTGFGFGAALADGKILTGGSFYPDGPGTHIQPIIARFQGPPAPPETSVLTSTVTSPKGRTIAAKKLKQISGTASTTVGNVTKVEIALQRIDKKLLKKSKRCLWLSSNKAKFKKVKASKTKKCSTPKWLKASGTTKWSCKLNKKLPKGSYVLQVRVTGGGATKVFASAKKFAVK